MTTIGGIQGHYNGKSYAVLFSDTRSTIENADGKGGKTYGLSFKLHASPQHNYAFGHAGIDLHSYPLEHWQQTILLYTIKMISGEFSKIELFHHLTFGVALLLSGRLMGREMIQHPDDLQSIDFLCSQFGKFATEHPDKLNVKDPEGYFPEAAKKYLSMPRQEFNSVLGESIRTGKTEFFDLMGYALHLCEKDAPDFIFSFNDTGRVELYAVTSIPPTGRYFVWPKVTNFLVGSGGYYAQEENSLAFGREHNEIEMPLRDAILHAIKMLQIAQSKDEYTSGLDIVIIKEDEMIAYRPFVDTNIERDPKGMLETILNTPL